jgi:outer membrane protein assembly factor BamB
VVTDARRRAGDGCLHALDIQNGQEKCKFQTGGGVKSSPAIADGVVYFGSADGYLYALK